MNKKHLFAVGFVALALAVLTMASNVEAQVWTAPTQAAPNGNTYPPLDTSSVAQTKSAGLLLNTGGAANGLIVQYGNVGIGNTGPGYKLEVAGSVAVDSGGGFYYASDRRLKTDIAPLSDALANVLKLQGVSFTWKTTGQKSVGVIAQDVEKVFPDLVHTNPSTGIKSVEYGNLVAPLIEAIKAQQTEIEQLQQEVADLKAGR